MKNRHRILSFLFLCIMTLGLLLSACEKNNIGTGDDETQETTSSVTLSPKEAYEASLPVRNYGGATINILATTQMEQYFYKEEQSVSTLEIAVYNRNIYVEDKYKAKLKYFFLNGNNTGASDFAAAIRASWLSGECRI